MGNSHRFYGQLPQHGHSIKLLSKVKLIFLSIIILYTFIVLACRYCSNLSRFLRKNLDKMATYVSIKIMIIIIICKSVNQRIHFIEINQRFDGPDLNHQAFKVVQCPKSSIQSYFRSIHLTEPRAGLDWMLFPVLFIHPGVILSISNLQPSYLCNATKAKLPKNHSLFLSSFIYFLRLAVIC